MNPNFWRDIDWGQIGQAALETLMMLGGSLIFVVLLGLPLGVVLFLYRQRPITGAAIFAQHPFLCC